MQNRLTVPDIRARKGQTPLVVLTAYSAPMARLLGPYVDILLVGDSVGMVLYGMENTRGVTLDMAIAHGRAVVKAASNAIVVVDMPFGSFHESPTQALASCKRVILETGAQALKLEGGTEMAETIHHLTSHGIAVMGHVGLMPQRVTTPDGYRYQGRNEEEAAKILADALAVEKAGAFSLVIEAVQEDVARHVTNTLAIPTIGIGASPACDGQVLVAEDMLGLSGSRYPSFVKPYANFAPAIENAVKQYADEVKNRKFPSLEFCFTGKKPKA